MKSLKQLQSTSMLFCGVIGTILLIISFVGESIGIGGTEGFGVLQMALLLIGFTFLTIAGMVWVYTKRPTDAPRSLQADIAIRIVATGVVSCYISGFSDLLSIGTHTSAYFERPHAGPLQLVGIGLGMIATLIGLWMYHTSRGRLVQSSINFLPSEDETPSTS